MEGVPSFSGLKMTVYGEILRTLLNKPVQSERDVRVFALRIAAVCLILALCADLVAQLITFGNWLDVLRAWVVDTLVVAVVAYPVGLYIGATRLEHHRVKAKFLEQSRNDSLTGLRHRSALSVDFDAAAPAGRRLLLLSLDRFKAINQQFGHPAGDRVLIRSARLIAEELANLGPIYRTDGTEFLILSTGSASADIKRQVLTLLTRFESSNFGTAERPISLTLSAGLAEAPAGMALGDAFAAADAALEAAKTGGRSRLCIGAEPAIAGLIEGDDIVWAGDQLRQPRRRKTVGE